MTDAEIQAIEAQYRFVLKETWAWDVGEHNVWFDDNGSDRLIARVPESGQDRWAHPESTINGKFIAAAPGIVAALLADNKKLRESRDKWRGLAQSVVFAVPNNAELKEELKKYQTGETVPSRIPTKYTVGQWLRVRKVMLTDDNKGYFPPQGKAEVIELKGLIELTASGACYAYRMRALDGIEFDADDDDLDIIVAE